MPHQLLKYRVLPNSWKMFTLCLTDFQEGGCSPIYGQKVTVQRFQFLTKPEAVFVFISFYMQYLQKDDDPVLCVLICCYVEHARPVAVHNPVVHLCVGAYISVGRFDSGHHRLHRQRLQNRVLIVL